jgi:hypothetical protein
MYIMYVDESGDPGSVHGSSEYFILTGLILNYKTWYQKLDRLKDMRRYFKTKYNLDLTVEIHSKELLRISSIKSYRKINKHQRINLLKEYASFIPKMFRDCWVINICFDKSKFSPGTDFNTLAFGRLITRYNMFLSRTVRDEGIIIADESNEKALRNLIRKMRLYNPVISRYTDKPYNARITKIIEDIVHRKSSTSYFIQTVDVIAFLLKHKEYPRGSTRKFNLNVLFDDLEPILLKVASSKDPLGIVRE